MLFEINYVLIFAGSALPVTFTLLQNLEAFLPSTARGLNGNVSSASVLLSSQVGVSGMTSESLTLRESPVLLNFSVPTIPVSCII